MKRRASRNYRGFRWSFTRFAAFAHVNVLEKTSDASYETRMFTLNYAITPWHTLKSHKAYVIEHMIPTVRERCRAIDSVPWEIHLIEDESAYRLALASYVKNAL